MFADLDFGDVSTYEKKFWRRLSANYWWYEKEQERKAKKIEMWRWAVYDNETGEEITPKI